MIGRPPVAPEIRFWAKVTKTDTCWMWTGARVSGGYGAFATDTRGTLVGAHIWAYVDAYGPIPPGLMIDHRCHDPLVCQLGRQCPHRRCVNPAHMAVVTPAENSSTTRRYPVGREKTHCPRGHPYDEQNTHITPQGWRACRTCAREKARIIRARLRANPPAAQAAPR